MASKNILTGKNADIMKALQNAIIPRGGAFEAGAADYDLIPVTEKILQSYDPRTRFFIPLILKYLQYHTIFRKGKVFTRLNEESAAEVLEKMETSRFYYRRGIVMMLKLLSILPFFDIDETAEQIGYSHGCHLNKKSSISTKSKKKTPPAKKKKRK